MSLSQASRQFHEQLSVRLWQYNSRMISDRLDLVIVEYLPTVCIKLSKPFQQIKWKDITFAYQRQTDGAMVIIQLSCKTKDQQYEPFKIIGVTWSSWSSS